VAAADALRVAWDRAVVVRADDVDGVGQAGRRVDVLVVPALACAEIIRRVVRARRRRRGQLLPAVIDLWTDSRVRRRRRTCRLRRERSEERRVGKGWRYE